MKVKRQTGYERRIRESINTHKSLARNCEQNRPLSRPGYRWRDNIKMNLKK
jgi:hypothetical protein